MNVTCRHQHYVYMYAYLRPVNECHSVTTLRSKAKANKQLMARRSRAEARVRDSALAHKFAQLHTYIAGHRYWNAPGIIEMIIWMRAYLRSSLSYSPMHECRMSIIADEKSCADFWNSCCCTKYELAETMFAPTLTTRLP